MIQCRDCEYYHELPDGSPHLLCDPFTNIKEPECIGKWQLMKLNVIVRAHERTLAMYDRLAPLQEKMLRHLKRELDENEEADSWKFNEEEEGDDENDFRGGY